MFRALELNTCECINITPNLCLCYCGFPPILSLGLGMDRHLIERRQVYGYSVWVQECGGILVGVHVQPWQC